VAQGGAHFYAPPPNTHHRTHLALAPSPHPAPP
jgi:hypothetical protein